MGHDAREEEADFHKILKVILLNCLKDNFLTGKSKCSRDIDYAMGMWWGPWHPRPPSPWELRRAWPSLEGLVSSTLTKPISDSPPGHPVQDTTCPVVCGGLVYATSSCIFTMTLEGRGSISQRKKLGLTMCKCLGQVQVKWATELHSLTFSCIPITVSATESGKFHTLISCRTLDKCYHFVQGTLSLGT